MANEDCTDSGCLSQVAYAIPEPVCYFVEEPDRPGYTAPISESVKQLAKNIRLLRLSHGWSQEALAMNAGLDRTFVGSVERAERNVTLATVEKIAKAFGCTAAQLLTLHNCD